MVRSDVSAKQLARMLSDIGAQLEDPMPSNFAASVRARLELETAPTRDRGWESLRVRATLTGVAAAIAVTMLLVLSTSARHAVAGWLGLRSVHIERVTTLPPPTLGHRLDLGEPVRLSEARRKAAYEVLLPPTSRFGPPDELYFADTVPGGRVDALYHSRANLPPIAGSDVGMLVTEFRATDTEVIRKGVPETASIEIVAVAGAEGVWLEGGRHIVTFRDGSGDRSDDRTRLAGNTLIWERGPLTLRLESGLTKTEAIRIAESIGTR